MKRVDLTIYKMRNGFCIVTDRCRDRNAVFDGEGLIAEDAQDVGQKIFELITGVRGQEFNLEKIPEV